MIRVWAAATVAAGALMLARPQAVAQLASGTGSTPDAAVVRILGGRQLIQGMDAPSWFGYSVGRWEGQSFVVTSHGFREESWLDLEGLPHSERLQLTERYLRPSFGKMTLQVTFDDPVMFTKTWTAAPIELRFVADTELMDRICENERDRAHLVGK